MHPEVLEHTSNISTHLELLSAHTVNIVLLHVHLARCRNVHSCFTCKHFSFHVCILFVHLRMTQHICVCHLYLCILIYLSLRTFLGPNVLQHLEQVAVPHMFVVLVHLHGCVSSFLVLPAPTLTNIFLYHSGFISAPNITNVIRVNSTSVRVILQRPESGSQCITSYTVQTQDGNSNTVDVSNSSVTEVPAPLDGLANIIMSEQKHHHSLCQWPWHSNG